MARRRLPPPAVLAPRRRIRLRDRRLAVLERDAAIERLWRWRVRFGKFRPWTWYWSHDRWIEEARKRGVI